MGDGVGLVVTCSTGLGWLSHVGWDWVGFHMSIGVGCHVSDGVELVVTCQVGLSWLSRILLIH